MSSAGCEYEATLWSLAETEMGVGVAIRMRSSSHCSGQQHVNNIFSVEPSRLAAIALFISNPSVRRSGDLLVPGLSSGFYRRLPIYTDKLQGCTMTFRSILDLL